MRDNKLDEEIFTNLEEARAIIWWLVHLLGDSVTFPVEPEFWEEHFPKDGSSYLALHKQDGKLILTAEKVELS